MLHVSFEFSDLIAGYVTGFDFRHDLIALQTSDGRNFPVKLTETTFSEMLRNLGEPFVDCTAQMRGMLMPGRFLFAYGVIYPECPSGDFVDRHEGLADFGLRGWKRL